MSGNIKVVMLGWPDVAGGVADFTM